MSLCEHPSLITAVVSADLALRHSGESFGRFRLVNPRTQARISASIKTYGRLAPTIVLASSAPPFELLDWRASRLPTSHGASWAAVRNL